MTLLHPGFRGNVWRHDDPLDAFNRYLRPKARRRFRTWARLGKLSIADYERLTTPQTPSDIHAFSRRADDLAWQAVPWMWFWYRPLWWRRREQAAR